MLRLERPREGDTMSEPTPTIGRIVHYVMTDEAAGKIRPAIVVAVVDATTLNLQVFSDGENDGGNHRGNVRHRTLVAHDAAGAPGTWHWPEHVATQVKASKSPER
jgi:hypothetical protein